jgi:hypothetical protein
MVIWRSTVDRGTNGTKIPVSSYQTWRNKHNVSSQLATNHLTETILSLEINMNMSLQSTRNYRTQVQERKSKYLFRTSECKEKVVREAGSG